jgi:hypothetical protein
MMRTQVVTSTRMWGLLVGCGLLAGACAEWEPGAAAPGPQSRRQTAQRPPARQVLPPRRVEESPTENALAKSPRDGNVDAQAADAVRRYIADLEKSRTPRAQALAGDDRSARTQPAGAPRERQAPAATREPRRQPLTTQASNPVQSTPAQSNPAQSNPVQSNPVADRRPTPVEPAPNRRVAPRPTTGQGDAASANLPLTLGTSRAGIVEPRSPRVLAVAVKPRGKSGESASAKPAAAVAQASNVRDPNTAKQAAWERLLAQSEAELAKNPTDAKLQWRVSMLRLAAGRAADAGALSPELTEQRRGLLARQIALESALMRMLEDEADGADQVYAALESLRDAVRDDAELGLPTLALCSKVTTFGVYDELPDAALVPHRANRAIVYCEIENLKAERDPSDRYRTLLSTRLELFDQSGKSRWTHEERRIEDISRQRREDFFIAQLVTFPADLSPGEYVLKASVTDLLGSKTNEVTKMVGIGGSAAGR